MAFKKANNDIMLWFKSPPERRKYPKSRLKNKNAFHKHIKKYSYNSESGSCRINFKTFTFTFFYFILTMLRFKASVAAKHNNMSKYAQVGFGRVI